MWLRTVDIILVTYMQFIIAKADELYCGTLSVAAIRPQAIRPQDGGSNPTDNPAIDLRPFQTAHAQPFCKRAGLDFQVSC